MGEYADMMLDGTLCEGCGTYLGDACDYVRYCGDCKPKNSKVNDSPNPEKMNCPTCNKRIKKAGLNMHNEVVHGIKPLLTT